MIEQVGNILENVLKTQFESHYTGEVVDVNDPNKQGRLKIRVRELYGQIPISHLPWAVPSPEFGGGYGYGSFWIPPIKSKVKIRLSRGHPWFPEWYGTHWFKGETPNESQVLPPDNHVLKTPSGHLVDISDVDGDNYIRIRDSSEKNFIIINTEDGSIRIKSDGDLNIASGGDISIQADGSIHMKAVSGSINEDGVTIQLNSGTSQPKAPEDDVGP